MSRYFDDSTHASLPGDLQLDLGLLRALQPELFEPGTMQCCTRCEVQHPRHKLVEKYTEHLMLCASEPALVVSTAPLVVSARAGDVGAAILLRFPDTYVERFGLRVGQRLLTINSYARDTSPDGRLLYPVDIIPGPERGRWTNANPIIADFVSRDAEGIATRKSQLGEDEWAAFEAMTQLRVGAMGIETARDGRPTHSTSPHPMTLAGRRVEYVEDGPPPTRRPSAPDPAPRASRPVVDTLFIALGILAVAVMMSREGCPAKPSSQRRTTTHRSS